MVVLTQTMVPAPEVSNDSFEDNACRSIGKEPNGVDRSMPSPLEIFAQEAIDNARTISTFLRSNNLPHPSFERDAPANAFLSVPKDVSSARSRLTEAALRMLQLAQGPQEYIPNLAVNVISLPQIPEVTTLMNLGAIRGMPAVADSFLHLSVGATG